MSLRRVVVTETYGKLCNCDEEISFSWYATILRIAKEHANLLPSDTLRQQSPKLFTIQDQREQKLSRLFEREKDENGRPQISSFVSDFDSIIK